MDKFLIVFNEQDRDKLLREGFKILHDKNGWFVFLNEDKPKRFFKKMEYVTTNTLLF